MNSLSTIIHDDGVSYPWIQRGRACIAASDPETVARQIARARLIADRTPVAIIGIGTGVLLDALKPRAIHAFEIDPVIVNWNRPRNPLVTYILGDYRNTLPSFPSTFSAIFYDGPEATILDDPYREDILRAALIPGGLLVM